MAELADLQRKLPEMDVPREVRALALWADGQRERSGPLQWLAATLVNKLASGKYLPRQPTRQWAALTRTPQREFELAEFEIRRRARQFGWAMDEVERRLRSVRQQIESASGRTLAVC